MLITGISIPEREDIVRTLSGICLFARSQYPGRIDSLPEDVQTLNEYWEYLFLLKEQHSLSLQAVLALVKQVQAKLTYERCAEGYCAREIRITFDLELPDGAWAPSHIVTRKQEWSHVSRPLLEALLTKREVSYTFPTNAGRALLCT